MKQAFKGVVIAVLFLAVAVSASYSETITPGEFVDQFSSATDIQRDQLEKHFKYQKMPVRGVVSNVEDWKAFDERTDTESHYYRVLTVTQKTGSGIPYDVIVFYKDKDKLELLNRGQEIRIEGTFLKIINERLTFSIWVYGEELTEKDREAFN